MTPFETEKFYLLWVKVDWIVIGALKSSWSESVIKSLSIFPLFFCGMKWHWRRELKPVVLLQAVCSTCLQSNDTLWKALSRKLNFCHQNWIKVRRSQFFFQTSKPTQNPSNPTQRQYPNPKPHFPNPRSSKSLQNTSVMPNLPVSHLFFTVCFYFSIF